MSRAAVAGVLLLLVAAGAVAQEIAGVGTTTTTNVTLTTTTEGVAVTSDAIAAPRETVQVVVLCYMQVTTGADTADLTPRIRRGSGITGTLISDAISEEIKAAVTADESLSLMASEERTGGGQLEYSCTVQQGSATGNGAVTQAGILVFAF